MSAQGVKISEKALHWCCVCGIIIYVCNTIGNDRYLHAGCVKMQRVVNCKKKGQMQMFKSKLSPPEGKGKERYLLLFIVAFVGMMIAFLPNMINNKGIFMYYGDFNSQQLMFYKHAQQMVKEGNFGWDWGTDLGSGFVGTYSFYLLGSPFFWLTTLFPVGSTVYLMPWLLAIKTGVAAMCAYAYIRRFITNRDCAAIGGLLYAFSGFQTYNIFFNHFHDATAFFPLLLLAFELLVQEKKRGALAL